MATEAFDDLADAYEAMIDWPKRLANEGPFYRELFQEIGARSVLDTACGTGHHAAMFHDWGLRVEGADLSPAMIQRCKASHGESDTLRWVVRGFDQPTSAPGAFDVVLCIGNSLALASDRQMMATALQRMFAAVRSGGAVVVHVLNLWRLPDGPCQWQKCQRAALPQGESLIIKGVHRSGPRGYVDILVTLLSSAAPALRSECVPFWGLETADLEQMARQTGATQVAFYANAKRQPYDRAKSQDLILLARK